LSLTEAHFPAGSMLILTLQGFGQHEPLIWLDLHGCSFVEVDDRQKGLSHQPLGIEDIRYKAVSVSRHAINPAVQEACGGAK
jgi:hypothetical protein